MRWTHAAARRLVERLELIGPCHGSVPGDLERVQDAFAGQPDLAAALNALDPARMEETPQGAAAHLGCREILALMLSGGVRLDLFMACALGQIDAAGAFLRREPRLAHACGAHGIHVLNHAANSPIAAVLLEGGADPNTVVYAPWGWTPLHEAAFRGRKALLEQLAAAGGVIDPGAGGTTPLHAAARMGHLGVAEWLLARGAAIDARGRGGPWQHKTPLTLAVEHDHDEIAALLRRHGARG
jgi:hypothetical protein